MWNGLRRGAYSWVERTLRVTSPTPPTVEEITAKANEFISHVTILDMNRYTKLAGEFLKARNNLHSLGPGDQIDGPSIFTPPWAKTADNPAVPTRYRIRVLRSIEYRGFTRINRDEWASYELTGPITSIQDAIDQANTLFSQADYNSRTSINAILDYSIEVV
jgi:hypothetical protein